MRLAVKYLMLLGTISLSGCMAKFSNYQSIYVSALNYGHEHLVMTKRRDCRYIRRVAVLSLRGRMRSLDILEKLGVEQAEVFQASG